MTLKEEEVYAILKKQIQSGGGQPGTPGRGIEKIEPTDTQGLVDTYTITYTDGTTTTYTVTNGEDGMIGATPNIQIGTVQTLEPGQNATASMTGTPENPLLNIGIPKGDKGDPGESGGGDSYKLPIMSATQLGGGKAVEKTDEDVPVAADPSTGQLFVPTYPELTRDVEVTIPAYTNQIPISLSADGLIFNGNGIKSGYALGSDGGENTNANLYVTGFIPVTKGDIIRVEDNGEQNFNTSIMFALYPLMVDSGTSIGKTVNDIMNNELYGSLSISGNTVTWDTSTIGYYFWENFAYARFTLTSSDAIVTVNEEIADTVKTEKILSDDIKVYEKNVIANDEDPDEGKDICVVFGDSIIGMVRDSTSVTSFAEHYSGQKFYNIGFGGCRMSIHPTSGYAAFSMWAIADAITSRDFSAQDAQATSGEDYFQEQLNKLKSIDFSEVNYIIIHYGTNDFSGNVTIKNNENEEDTNTLCGALRYSLNKIQSTFKNIKIFISVPIFRMWDMIGADTYENSNGNKLTDFVESLIEIAEEYHLPVINGYKNLGINLKNGSYFLTDGTHLSNSGRKNFGQYISNNVF